MDYEQVNQARRDAEETIRRADMVARQAARLIQGRLRIAEVDGYVLKALKHELQSFDAAKRKWKDAEK